MRPKKTYKRESIIERFFVYFFLLLLVVWISGYFFNRGEKVNRLSVDSIYKGISVQVLNGCGVKGISQVLSELLRAEGFTVDNFGNASSMDYPETIILDRKGNRSKAMALADFLGLDSSFVVLQRASDFVYTDLVLIIGKDYKRYFKREGL